MTTWTTTQWSASARTLLQARSGYGVRHLVYLTAKDRGDDSAVPLGLSTCDEDTSFTLDGVTRTYAGLQDHLVPPVLKFQQGTNIQTVQLTMVGVLPEAQEAILTYNVKLAPVEIHVALYDAGMTLVAIRRRFKGIVNTAPIFTPPQEGVSEAQMELVSSARRGTLTVSAKKSDEAQSKRSGDRGRRYGSLGTVNSDWIGKRG